MSLTRFMCTPAGMVDLEDIRLEDLPDRPRRLLRQLAGGFVVGDNTSIPASQHDCPEQATSHQATANSQRQQRQTAQVPANWYVKPGTKCTQDRDGAKKLTFEQLPTHRGPKKDLLALNRCSLMEIDYPSVAPGDWDDTVNLRTDRNDEDHETKAIHLCRFAEVIWQDSTLSLGEKVRYWPQQEKAYFDRPDVASLPGGVPGLISTQWNTDLRAPKRS
jgi:hypothetical protein